MKTCRYSLAGDVSASPSRCEPAKLIFPLEFAKKSHKRLDVRFFSLFQVVILLC